MRRWLGLIGVLATVAALPAPAADLGPGTVVGKVTEVSSSSSGRKIWVTAGKERWTLHLSRTNKVFHAGRRYSLHDVDEGMYVKARGKRIGERRLEVERLDVAGDRAAFRKAQCYRPSAPEGYFVPRHF
ncbi:MAG: hypothetical protein ACK47B_11595 [Armatimonadota bacterium]